MDGDGNGIRCEFRAYLRQEIVFLLQFMDDEALVSLLEAARETYRKNLQ